MSSHDWLIWGAYAFFALALCYLAESFWWNANLIETLWVACLLSSGIFFAAAELLPPPGQLQSAKVRSRR